MIRKENDRKKKETIKLKAENKEAKEKLIELDRKLEWIEWERRRNNLIVTGLKTDKKDVHQLKKM